MSVAHTSEFPYLSRMHFHPDTYLNAESKLTLLLTVCLICRFNKPTEVRLPLRYPTHVINVTVLLIYVLPKYCYNLAYLQLPFQTHKSLPETI